MMQELYDLDKKIDEVLSLVSLVVVAGEGHEKLCALVKTQGRVLELVSIAARINDMCFRSGARYVKDAIEEHKAVEVFSAINNKLLKLPQVLAPISTTSVHHLFMTVYSFLLDNFRVIQAEQCAPLVLRMDEGLQRIKDQYDAACDAKQIDTSTAGIQKRLALVQAIPEVINKEGNALYEECQLFHDHSNPVFARERMRYLSELGRYRQETQDMQKKLQEELADSEARDLCEQVEDFCKI